MVGSHRNCAVRLCNSSGRKAKVLMIDISFHVFPKNNEIKNEWIKRCKRPGNFWNPATSFVCSLHFKPEDYERNLRAELLGYKGRKKLKFGALPSLNLPYYNKEEPQINLNVESIEAIWIKEQQKLTSTDVFNNSTHSCEARLSGVFSESEEETMNGSPGSPTISIKTEIDSESDPINTHDSSENASSKNQEPLNGSEAKDSSTRIPFPLPITPVTIKIEKESQLDSLDRSTSPQNIISITKQEESPTRTLKRKLSSNSNTISNEYLDQISPNNISMDNDDDYDTFGKLIAFQLRELSHNDARICKEKIELLIKEHQSLQSQTSSREETGTNIKEEPTSSPFIKSEMCSDTESISEEY